MQKQELFRVNSSKFIFDTKNFWVQKPSKHSETVIELQCHEPSFTTDLNVVSLLTVSLVMVIT